MPFMGKEGNTYFLSTGSGIYGGAVQKEEHKFWSQMSVLIPTLPFTICVTGPVPEPSGPQFPV